MDIVLYQYPGGDGLTSVSPPCVHVEMALRRAGAEHRVVNLKSFVEARKFSVTGRLPALEIDGQRLSDSIVIVDELERRFPEAKLSPSDEPARTRDRLWEHFFTESVYFMGYYLRWISEDNRDRWIGSLFRNAPFMIRTFGPSIMKRATLRRAREVGIAGKTSEQVDRAYERALDMAVSGLGDGPYLEGRPEPGRGDLAAAALLSQAGFRGTLPAIERKIRDRPALLQHVRRVYDACSMKRPAWLVE